MLDADQPQPSEKIVESLILASSGWKVVYYINDNYFIEDIIAYAFIKSGNYHELVPLTLPDLYSCQTLQDYTLKDGYIGLIDPQNELIVNDYLEEELKEINIQEIKRILKKNRFKLD